MSGHAFMYNPEVCARRHEYVTVCPTVNSTRFAKWVVTADSLCFWFVRVDEKPLVPVSPWRRLALVVVAW